MEVLLLGPLEVRDEDRSLTVPGGLQRALLALLALNAGRAMPAERLIQLLWGSEAPRSATNALQVHVSALRKIIEPHGPPFRTLLSQGSGYMLKLNPDQVDLARFERLVDRAHRALTSGEVAQCAQLVANANGLWRGSALEGLIDQPWSIGEARRLEQLRLMGEEDRIEAELALGRHIELVGELEALVAEHPLRERFRAQLMLALYRSGRQAEASAVFQQTREVLVEQLGMEPGYHLQLLLKRILNQDPSLHAAVTDLPTPRLDNLPAPLTSFVGRIDALAEITGLISQHRLVTLTGPGGVGKTRLAIEAARWCLDKYERGVWLTELAPIEDPALVPEAIAMSMAIRVQSDQLPSERLIASLSNRPYLLVVDNCEHLVDACAKLSEAILSACRHVTILATSREPLGVAGELVWSVPPMQLPGESPSTRLCETVELFQQRAVTALGSFQFDERSLDLASKLCSRLDGIPLAIELAAVKLKVLSLEDLLVRLDDRFRLLTGGSRTAMPRQQTLRATIDWSYELLTPNERLLLCLLSVFAGSFTLLAAENVCDLDLLDSAGVLEGISGLVKKSFIQVQQRDVDVRYRMMDTIRQYAHERLRQQGHQAALSRRHRDFYLDLAERAAPQLRGPNGNVWMRNLVTEHDNIRAALRWSLAEGEYDVLARFLIALGWFWYLRCFFRESRDWFATALEHVEAPATTRTRLLIWATELAWAQGDHGPARGLAGEALSLALETGDDVLIGDSLQRLALVDHGAGDLQSERKHLEESIERFRRCGSKLLLAEALNNLGWTRGVLLNEGSAAEPLLSESLMLARQCGDLWLQHAVLDSIARLAMSQGRYAAAREYQEDGLRVCIELGDLWSVPYLLDGFVELDCKQRRFERALQLAGAASRRRDELRTAQLPAEKERIDRLVNAARSRLDQGAAEAAWHAGWEMTEADAVKFALAAPTAILHGVARGGSAAPRKRLSTTPL